MARKEKNGDISILISKSRLGHKSQNYQKTVGKWEDKHWALVDEQDEGDFVRLRFKYKRFVLRPNPVAFRFGPGQNAPTIPHLERYLTREEAEKAAEANGKNRFIVDETEPPAD
jgi:hypothetical protein